MVQGRYTFGLSGSSKRFDLHVYLLRAQILRRNPSLSIKHDDGVGLRCFDLHSGWPGFISSRRRGHRSNVRLFLFSVGPLIDHCLASAL